MSSGKSFRDLAHNILAHSLKPYFDRIIYFLLLILRAIALIKSKFWRRFFGSNFRLGPGEISLTFSLKFSRPQDVEQHNDGEEAGPSSGRGAVYI